MTFLEQYLDLDPPRSVWSRYVWPAVAVGFFANLIGLISMLATDGFFLFILVQGLSLGALGDVAYPLVSYRTALVVSSAGTCGRIPLVILGIWAAYEAEVFDLGPKVVAMLFGAMVALWLITWGILCLFVFVRRRWFPMRIKGRCPTCGYSLFGLPGPRCPECGTDFDPNDRQTAVARKCMDRQTMGVVGTYIAVIIVTVSGWLVADGSTIPGDPVPHWGDRVHVAVWQLTGPASWFFVPDRAGTAGLAWLLCLSMWTLWIVVVLRSRLKGLAQGWHLLFALCWSLSGFARVGGEIIS